MRRIFDHPPSRRADYEARTQGISSDYPLQFCVHFWVENERVATRVRKIWPSIVETINFGKVFLKEKSQEKERLEQTPVMSSLFNSEGSTSPPKVTVFWRHARQIIWWSPFLQIVLRLFLGCWVQTLSGKTCLRVLNQPVYW